MREIVTIAQRFCGPPRSANGGYACGLLAGYVGAQAEVRLCAPPPLERALHVDRAGGAAALRDGDRTLAQARPAPLTLDVPSYVSFAAARAAAREDFADHPFPRCFVCGPAREHGDGLRIHPGPLAGSDTFAATWTPSASVADARGRVRPEFLWAALDCPGVYPCGFKPGEMALLGTLHAHVRGEVAAGEPCTVLAWPLGREGRKHFAGTAIYGPRGDVRALARATWIRIDTPPA